MLEEKSCKREYLTEKFKMQEVEVVLNNCYTVNEQVECCGGGKIVCTMMNERYGFGSFRNKIWMKFHESYGPEYH